MKCEDSQYYVVRTIIGKNYRAHKKEATNIGKLKQVLSIQSSIPVNKQIIIINMEIMKNDNQPLIFKEDQQPFILLASSDKPTQILKENKQNLQRKIQVANKQFQELQQQMIKSEQRTTQIIAQTQRQYNYNLSMLIQLRLQKRMQFINTFVKMGYAKQFILQALRQAGNDLHLAQQYITEGVHQSKGKNLHTLLLCNEKKDNILKIFFNSPHFKTLKDKRQSIKDVNLMYFIFQKIVSQFPSLLQFDNALQIFSHEIFGKSIQFNKKKHSKCTNPNCFHHYYSNYSH